MKRCNNNISTNYFFVHMTFILCPLYQASKKATFTKAFSYGNERHGEKHLKMILKSISELRQAKPSWVQNQIP